ncbi:MULTISPECIES: hypothetical protein [Clostridium]|uniref:Uncharacterized protein n=2 Tax=Clostridium TaxID=1485 RepID=D8GK17_CLOLD|nr:MULTISPECIES: hypothetical protein [Clostridium]ADK13135.1 hypothetical protein CLJU_c00280 [Clostridium ljungdahlii DSM 13528]AGY76358.1 hypothetical protein CAETHG_2145 [Clostridium autoethanogenum DSM 10061]ALU36521.1 Hypothetical protein CLAU_2092 [Clostridium autoethanogenum DSM 10061]OAA84373.1 hypothetical protein WX45_01036 [Clostridium ljungdahlii DSM 13528]OVY48607.1 hypothetical protein WX72_00428 [Clostridium autoethanogenum]
MIEKLLKILRILKNKNNEDMQVCQRSCGAKDSNYVRGYIDALKQQNELLDKQIAIFEEE